MHWRPFPLAWLAAAVFAAAGCGVPRDEPPPAGCGSCHGLPPAAPHPDDERCSLCHASAYRGGELSPALHGDSRVQLGDGSGGCTACHGDSTSPAPPRDTSGATDPALATVGAHRAHVLAPSGWSAPIDCSQCHADVREVRSAGHFDGAAGASVFPEVEGSGALSGRSEGLSPRYDRETGSCTSVYCHGNGFRLAPDRTPNLHREPVWTDPRPLACGSCHGVPPADGKHDGKPLTECVRCHAKTMAADGSLVVQRDPSTGRVTATAHLDGRLQIASP